MRLTSLRWSGDSQSLTSAQLRWVNLIGITVMEELMFRLWTLWACSQLLKSCGGGWPDSGTLWKHGRGKDLPVLYLRSQVFWSICTRVWGMIFKEESIPLDDFAGSLHPGLAFHCWRRWCLWLCIILPVKSGCPNAWTSRRDGESEFRWGPSFFKWRRHRQAIELLMGELTITFTPKKEEFRSPAATSFWKWLSICGASNLILNQLPMEICPIRMIFSNITTMLRLWGSDF